MLFMAEFIHLILSGNKTQTRRHWKRKPPKVGSVIFAQTKLFKNETRFARIKILRVWECDPNDISIDDVIAEGFLDKSDFIRTYRKLNEKKWDDKSRKHWAIEFEVVERL